jgi:hypothetical protein
MGAITPLHVYVKELETLLSDEIDRLMINLSNGHLETHAEYKYLAGKIAGLRSAIDLMEEAQKVYQERYM